MITLQFQEWFSIDGTRAEAVCWRPRQPCVDSLEEGGAG